MNFLDGYPIAYKNYADSILAASKSIEDYAILERSGPNDPGMVKVTDHDADSSYFLDACPRWLKPNPLLHYLTPSDVAISEAGSKWLWADKKPANIAFEKMAKDSCLFSDIARKLSKAMESQGYEGNEEMFADYLRQCSYCVNEAGYWIDGGNSMQNMDLWRYFSYEAMMADLRVLIAGDIVYRMGSRDSFFDEAEGCVQLSKLVLGIFVKPSFKLGKRELTSRFMIDAKLMGSVPMPKKMLSEKSAWDEMF